MRNIDRKRWKARREAAVVEVPVARYSEYASRRCT
jgi:hypothetical protein